VDQKKENANLLEQIAYYKLAITEVKDEENPEENKEINNNSKMRTSFQNASSTKKISGPFSNSKSAYQSAYPIDKSWKANEKDTIDRYKDVIEKLKGTLETENRKLKNSRIAYAKEMQAKTELEELLYQCVEEVRNEAQNKKTNDKITNAGIFLIF